MAVVIPHLDRYRMGTIRSRLCILFHLGYARANWGDLLVTIAVITGMTVALNHSKLSERL
jgi:hypothetical protein